MPDQVCDKGLSTLHHLCNATAPYELRTGYQSGSRVRKGVKSNAYTKANLAGIDATRTIISYCGCAR